MNLLVSLSGLINGLEMALVAIAALVGVFALGRGTWLISRIDGQDGGWGAVAGNILIGSLLCCFSVYVGLATSSLFGSSAIADASVYTPSNVTDASAQQAIQATLSWIQFIGFVALLRSALMLLRLSEGRGQETGEQAFYWVLGGTIAANLPGVLQSLQSAGYIL